jgi:hypothetical protein
VGYACFMPGDYSRALRVLQAFVSRAPLAGFGHSWLAATHVQLGQLDEARAATAELPRLRPGFAIGARWRIAPFRNPKDAEHFFGALHKAGIPE